MYCANPSYLHMQLAQSLERLNLSTIDCAFIQTPHEAYYHLYGWQEYLDFLAKIFEYYEAAVKAGKIRSYGLVVNQSVRFSQQ